MTDRSGKRFSPELPRSVRSVKTSVLVVGGRGQLGRSLLAQGEASGVSLAALTRDDADLRSRGELDAVVSAWAENQGEAQRLVVVNVAGFTAVDAAETDQEVAFALNGEVPRALAEACVRIGASLVQISTDYVFAGTADRPYEVDDVAEPVNAYGRSKLAGEQAVLELLPQDGYVVRTAWLYGATGRNFFRTMVRLEAEQDSVEVVADQRGSPTWSTDLARGLLVLAVSQVPPGVYHSVNAGEATWYELARAVFEGLGADPGRIRPTTTKSLELAARRPAYSVLSTRAWTLAGLPPLRGWREALAELFRTGMKCPD